MDEDPISVAEAAFREFGAGRAVVLHESYSKEILDMFASESAARRAVVKGVLPRAFMLLLPIGEIGFHAESFDDIVDTVAALIEYHIERDDYSVNLLMPRVVCAEFAAKLKELGVEMHEHH